VHPPLGQRRCEAVSAAGSFSFAAAFEKAADAEARVDHRIGPTAAHPLEPPLQEFR